MKNGGGAGTKDEGRCSMLVLSRKAGERIIIGDTVVTILKVNGQRARIGIDAPPRLKVLRGELVDQQEDQQMIESGT